MVRVRATKKGQQLMQRGRGRRVSVLAAWLKEIGAAELTALAQSADIIERLVRDAEMH